jgi:hypothetical protein
VKGVHGEMYHILSLKGTASKISPVIKRLAPPNLSMLLFMIPSDGLATLLDK